MFNFAGLASAVNVVRKQRGLTWAEVSEGAGVSASSISRFRSVGAGLSVDSIIRLCNWGNLRFEDFAQLNRTSALSPMERIAGMEHIAGAVHSSSNLSAEQANTIVDVSRILYTYFYRENAKSRAMGEVKDGVGEYEAYGE